VISSFVGVSGNRTKDVSAKSESSVFAAKAIARHHVPCRCILFVVWIVEEMADTEGWKQVRRVDYKYRGIGVSDTPKVNSVALSGTTTSGNRAMVLCSTSRQSHSCGTWTRNMYCRSRSDADNWSAYFLRQAKCRFVVESSSSCSILNVLTVPVR
jgi:hypothetical protein